MAPKAAARIVAEEAPEEVKPMVAVARPGAKKASRLQNCDERLEKLSTDLQDTVEALSRGDVDFEDLFSD